MEPQINISCCNRRNRRCRIDLILAILIALLTFTIGVIIGAALSSIILPNLAAVIILAILLLVFIVLQAISLHCNNDFRQN